MFELRVEESGGRGTWTAYEDGVRVAYITFTRRPPDVLLVDYVRTLPDFGGRGIGTRTSIAAAEWARDQGLRVYPICPFFRSVMDQHKEFDGIRADL